MIAIAEFVSTLKSQGVAFSLEGESLIIDAPGGLLTEGLKAELRARKPEIVELLLEHHGLPEERTTWAKAAFELAETAGWPRLPFKQGHAVASGEACWGYFLASHDAPDLKLVVTALRRYVAAIPSPGEEPEPCRCAEMPEGQTCSRCAGEAADTRALAAGGA